jgi:hypothetical protein
VGKKSRDKGNRVERELVLLHRGIAGVHAERVPLSGAAGGLFDSDLRISVADLSLKAECKARGDGAGFKQLEKWLGSNDLLLLKRDRAEPLCVMPWSVYAKLLQCVARAAGRGEAAPESLAAADAPGAIVDAPAGKRGEG